MFSSWKAVRRGIDDLAEYENTEQTALCGGKCLAKAVHLPCYSDIKDNDIWPFAATRMDLEMIILREVSQKEKNPL